MCGILFVHQGPALPIDPARFRKALERQSWRGPDATGTAVHRDGQLLLGNNRLSIIDPLPHSNQPIRSGDGRYEIVFNGEIYNHVALREKFDLVCRHGSDTETIVELFSRIGTDAFGHLDGMFALVIVDLQTTKWWAVRDFAGIKPLYYSSTADAVVIASEPATVDALRPSSRDAAALDELRLARRPVPGHSFFEGVKELLPGHVLTSDGDIYRFTGISVEPRDAFDQDRLAELLRRSVYTHEMSDVPVVSMLSGGIDSALVAALSSVRETYCVGLPDNNECDAARDTARETGKNLNTVLTDADEMTETWRRLCRLRGEPLSVPNEGLIYLCCKAMKPSEKVVLTGEGADELFFGYDGIFRWALDAAWPGAEAFLRRYGYSDTVPVGRRLSDYVEEMKAGKSVLDFVEDFFLHFHLPGLLRRMDFASMAASREARVPFVSRDLVQYMYRREAHLRLDPSESKIPLRRLCDNLGTRSTLERRKIGFSATPSSVSTRQEEYRRFYDLCLEAIEWS
ncbi:asparagine synthase (glutamine-hydrolyzing) [Parvibaculum sp.]|uniref:asparagine synthase (glutamine-hydrolyzing) n=1 Tax=Parvibaculum sp. TaxID=2024848 RepID=UPI00262F6E23|nr:asparagine synthase (glutamine-hydrolyzing) [Parvibaculum sp.]MCW5726925.1 asparagine synthase (glutamine-hydrolyzing) [Parvibaculum sp.]